MFMGNSANNLHFKLLFVKACVDFEFNIVLLHIVHFIYISRWQFLVFTANNMSIFSFNYFKLHCSYIGSNFASFFVFVLMDETGCFYVVEMHFPLNVWLLMNSFSFYVFVE